MSQEFADHSTISPEQITTLIVNRSDTAAAGPLSDTRMLDGRYKVLEVRGGSGKSGMGIVYIVQDGEKRYAVKTFQSRFARDLVLVQRFIREARTWMLLGFHPNIVHAYKLDIIDAVPFLFMEFVESDEQKRHSVVDWLKTRPLPLHKALDIAVQICDGMAHANAAAPGLVHRDLKPENILITPDGIAKITDFGLVRCGLEEATLHHMIADGPDNDILVTQAGAIFGTPAYMAPEQFSKAAEVTVAADIYAFGCLLHEMLTRKPPFNAKRGTTLERILDLRRQHVVETPPRLSEILPTCPPEIEGIILHCLAKNPEERWPDFVALRNALADAMERHTNAHPRTLPMPEPTAREVGEQMRSLNMLDGYDQAIRLRNLREHQTKSPYAFHLALASYFHFHEDQREEERQLIKALRARRDEPGFEVVRRLATLYVDAGRMDDAEALLGECLAMRPEALEHLLEPKVRLLLRQGHIAGAVSMVEHQPPSLRADWLRIELYAFTGQAAERAALLQRLLDEALDRLADKLAHVQPDDLVAWARDGDAVLLHDLMKLLRPTCSTAILNLADHVIWPDFRGFPDMAPDMAWASEWLGEIAKHPDTMTPEQHQLYRDCAEILDYPRRLKELLERDETWFWSHESGQPTVHGSEVF